MQEEKVYELICETEKVIDKLIGSLIVTIVVHEKYRAELISMLDKEEKIEIGSLERSYFYSGPPKVLYIKIPSLPVSFNRAMRSSFARGKNVYSSLFEWWDIKIKNAIDNIEYIDSKRRFVVFDKATIIVKFTFPTEILRDIDNYAVKAIIDSVKKNRIVKEDNKNVIPTILPIMTTGDEQGIEVFVTEDDFPIDMINKIYKKYKCLFESTCKNQEEQQENEGFFVLKSTSFS